LRGQSEVAFAFTRLLGFELLPRLKGIHAQKLYRPSAAEAEAHPRLAPVLQRPIEWDISAQNSWDERGVGAPGRSLDPDRGEVPGA
jgi:TnpA family transposase